MNELRAISEVDLIAAIGAVVSGGGVGEVIGIKDEREAGEEGKAELIYFLLPCAMHLEEE